MNTRLVLAAGAVAVAAIGAFVFLQHDEPSVATRPAPMNAAKTGPSATESNERDVKPPSPEEMAAAAAVTREVPDPEGSKDPLLPALPLQKGELAWEARIRGALETPGAKDSEIARRLFEMMPGLPVEGRVRAAEEAIQRTPSAEYVTVAQPVLANPGTYPPSLIVLFSDLMERPDEVRLPALLAIARNSEHPLAREAQGNLAFVLKQDAGTDWVRWEGAIRAKLSGKL
jgi:hypothetical protein